MLLAVVGLGYVGLPLAVAFSKYYRVIGFDINEKKTQELSVGLDKMGEVAKEELLNDNLIFTSDPRRLKDADFISVAVPTPVLKSKMPDFSYLENSSKVIGENLKRNAVVVFESTVYPGATEEICVPILEKCSGMRCGVDFKIAYSPERINPGDKEHSVNKIVKVVSGMDAEALEKVAEVYGKISPIYRASSIKVAEAAKVIENTQRDLNIALVNELSLIFHKLGIDTKEVLEAAGTKWNFHKYVPGLVGGHCISVDPYYLTYKAEEVGYYPKVILSGREVNDYMPKHLANLVVHGFNEAGKVLKECSVLVMGLTFKENVPDIRNSKIADFIEELKTYKIKVIGCDPLLEDSTVKRHFNVENVMLKDLKEKVDCIVFAQPHVVFKSLTLADLKSFMNEKPLFIDVKGFFDKKTVLDSGIMYRRL